jgi:hypothetical protein
MAGVTRAMAAARVELERGYVAFVVSDELLPADVRRQVGMPAAPAGVDSSKAPAVGDKPAAAVGDKATGAVAAAAASLQAAAAAGAGAAGASGAAAGAAAGATKSGSAEAAAAAVLAAAVTTPVAASGLSRPGIARARNQAAMQAATQAAARRPLWVIVQSDEPPAPPEALSAVPAPDVQPTRGILRHRHSKANNGAVIGGHGSHVALPAHAAASDWAADALALATSSPGRATEEFAEEFHFSDDPGSSPDIHSGGAVQLLNLVDP